MSDFEPSAPFLPARQFHILIGLVGLSAYIATACVLKSFADLDVWSALDTALWCAAPVVLWALWALLGGPEGRRHQLAAFWVGVPLGGALALMHYSIAHSDSSTAVLGYLTIPLGCWSRPHSAYRWPGSSSARSPLASP
jgi:hypothetical protein